MSETIKVLSITLEELQELHVATNHEFFKCGEKDENGHDMVVPTIGMQEGKYIYGRDRFVKTFPEIDISSYNVVDYVPQEIEIL